MSATDSELSTSKRREALKDLLMQARGCERCTELAATRRTVVFGAGNADAELMFIGEAPGASEDEQGLPFVGRAGKLLDQLLVEIGMERKDVFVANVLKCRPPGNRDPLPIEIENCHEYLLGQVELIQPAVICTLGNFSTKLLRADPTGITRLHGQPEVLTIGSRTVRLYPIYHPAAALYTPRMLETLREDFARLPELLGLGAPEQLQVPKMPEMAEAQAGAETAAGAEMAAEAEEATGTELAEEASGAEAAAEAEQKSSGPDQLGLF